ncbi:MAG: hypothetical protein ACI9U2_001499 [Bradymonadia bacterium]|jgi:hypothetical protein
MPEIIDVESRIDRVCVYRNGALVTRVAAAVPGPMRVAGLPLLYAADSLRVSPAHGRVSDLRETCAVQRSGPVGRAATAEELERLADVLEEVDAEASALTARSKIYAQLDPANTHAGHLPSPDVLLEMHTTATEKLAALEARHMALRDRRRELERQMQVVQAVVHADPAPPRFTRGVELVLHAQSDAPVQIEIEYFVEAARWVPSYRLDLADNQAALRLDAMIAQASGEDWRDVTLLLGTADLDRETELPALASWRIGASGPASRPAYRPLPDDLETLFAGFDRASRPSVEPITQVRYSLDADDETGAFDTGAFKTSTFDDARTLASALMPMETVELTAPFDTPMPPGAMPAPMPMPTRARSPSLMREQADGDFAMPSNRHDGLAGGGGPADGGAADDVTHATVQPPSGDRLRRLRFAYLKLRGPAEAERGTLQAVDPLVHLATLLADHDVDDLDALQRAVDALRIARDRLRETLTPTGTRPTQDGFHHVYRAGALHDVPADGHWHRAVVRTDDAPASVDYRAVPRASRDVFRVCSVTPPQGVPYPAGPMQVYIDGTFRVTAPLQATGGGARMALNLGLDRGVRVVDRQVESRQHDKGLMSHTTHVTHTVTIELRSTLSTPAAVRLYDRLPVVGDRVKDVEVSLIESTPELEHTHTDAVGDRLDGGVRWALTLPPGGTQSVVYAYRVTFPAKAELVGGNRRE